MSSSNVELIRSLTQSWNESADPGLDAYHEDAEFDFGGWGFDFSGSFRGREVIGRMVGDVEQTWEEIKVEPVEFIDAGDKVVLSGRFLLRQRGTGLQVRDSGSCVYTLLDGKIARVELYRDHEQALQAAGVKQAADRSPLARPSWRGRS
jgi:ketosteroid isomerase-like protein